MILLWVYLLVIGKKLGKEFAIFLVEIFISLKIS